MALLLISLVAGLFVGWQVFPLMLWAVWGAPPSPLQFVGLAGAWGLDVAGALALKRKTASTLTTVFSCAAAWCFYVPALSVTAPHHRAVLEASAFVPPALLLTATVCAVVLTVLLLTRQRQLRRRYNTRCRRRHTALTCGGFAGPAECICQRESV